MAKARKSAKKAAPKKKVVKKVAKKAAPKAKKVVAKKASPKKAVKKKVTSPKTAAPKVVAKVSAKAARISVFMSPLDDRVLVNILQPAQKTAGGLFIPDTVSERPSEGEVLAVGPGRTTKKGVRRPLDVKIGDKVMYGQYSGHPLELDGEKYLILREDEILGVIE